MSSPRPADGTASEFFRTRRFIGSKDRRAVAERAWGVMRRWARLAWHVRQAAAATWLPPGEELPWESIAPRPRLLADLIVTDGLHVSDVEQVFSGADYGPYPLNSQERALLKALRDKPLNDPTMPDWVRGEVPEWILPRFATLWPAPEALPAALVAMNTEAPVDLRVNTLKTDRDAAQAALRAEGVETVTTTLSPWGLRLSERVNLPATKTFRDGLVEVQDEGSQLVAQHTGAVPGMAVCDFCAGAGGKTLALAAMMENKGRLVACDVSEGRLNRSAQRLKRAEVHNVTLRPLSGERDKWVKRSKGSFDVVLIDAPCSGTGTWRRNPDARWRLTEQTLRDLCQQQAEILDSAARLVKPGGRLVYATCSLLPEENEAQIDRFLATTGEAWQRSGEALRLDPLTHGTDGFFMAALTRLAP